MQCVCKTCKTVYEAAVGDRADLCPDHSPKGKRPRNTSATQQTPCEPDGMPTHYLKRRLEIHHCSNCGKEYRDRQGAGRKRCWECNRYQETLALAMKGNPSRRSSHKANRGRELYDTTCAVCGDPMKRRVDALRRHPDQKPCCSASCRGKIAGNSPRSGNTEFQPPLPLQHVAPRPELEQQVAYLTEVVEKLLYPTGNRA